MSGESLADQGVCYDSSTLVPEFYEDSNVCDRYPLVPMEYFSHHSPKPADENDFIITEVCHSNDALEIKAYNKGVIALEMISLLVGGVAVPRLLGIILPSIGFASISYGVSEYCKHDEVVDSHLQTFGKVLQGVLMHATFFEIVTNENLRGFFKSHVLANFQDPYILYTADLVYFVGGNVASQWLTDSLVDIQNKIFFNDSHHKPAIELDHFVKKKMPLTITKRFIKEVVKDAILYGGIKKWDPDSLAQGNLGEFENYLQFRLNPDLRSSIYNDLDDSTVPSLFAHFSANIIVASSHNGFGAWLAQNVFIHTLFKYIPDRMLNYVATNYFLEFKKNHGVILKYTTMLVTTGTYMLGKYYFPHR